MKAKFKTMAVVACTAMCALTLPACNVGKSIQLGKPATATSLEYYEHNDDGFSAFKQKVEKFASEFAPSVYENYEEQENFAVSPVSVYMALSLAAECADGETRTELLNALGVSYEQLREYIPMLYRSLNVEYKSGTAVTSTLKLGNSIWVNDGTEVKQDCIDALSNYYYSYSYSADFKNDTANANQAIRNFVKEQTRGLIDKDFSLTEDTLFTLINTLYLKTVWNDEGRDLPFAEAQYDFMNKDGTKKRTKLLQGEYRGGKVYEGENYSTFFTSTYNGFKIKFIVPKDGYGVDDVFTAKTISEVNSITDYNYLDEENKIIYSTRCLFPEYKSSFDGNIKQVLQSKFGINEFFDKDYCNLSTLSEDPSYCKNIAHVTHLTVNKKGIEGAAVTVIRLDGATAADPSYKNVYEDFIVDRAFGYIITDSHDVTLFSGVVNKV